MIKQIQSGKSIEHELTTCLVEAMLNRKFIGIEKDEKYYNIANKRLNEFGY